MKNDNDNCYIDKVINGNLSAYSILVDKYKNMAVTLAFKIVRNREDAEEIAQDAFLNAFKSLREFKRNSSFSTWLYRIVYNIAVSRIRKSQIDTISIEDRHFEDYNIENINAALNNLKQEDEKKYIKQALSELTESEELIVTLFYLNESTVKEISDITGLTISNIKIILMRTRKKLLGKLEKILKD